MSDKKPADRLSKGATVKAGFGTVGALVGALVGAMAVQGGLSQASAATLNGEFFFVPLTFGTSAPAVTFSGPTLASATSVTFLAPSSNPFVQLVVNSIPASYNAKPNDFDGTVPTPPAYSMNTGSLVKLKPLTLAPSNLNRGYLANPIAAFLTWSASSFLGTGTTPNDRFTYDLNLASWTSASPNHLDLDTFGFVRDTLGVFSGDVAELHLALVSGCDLTSAACSVANAAWAFESPGTGGRSLIPEPISLTLLGVGLVGIAAARRRRL